MLFKLLVLSYQSIYFPFSKVRAKDRLQVKGPAIIVSNHPNTMLDPLHPVSRTVRRVFFLVNAGMFKHPWAAAFLKHFSIPISRPGKDDSSIKVNNKKSFQQAFQHLQKGKLMYIAPEGTSVMERHLRPLKTGTARIALGAELEKNFELGVQIIPVGVNYEHPDRCGSRVFVNVGEPIAVKKWQEGYATAPKETVRALTQELEERMQALLIHTDDEAQDKLLYRLESILQNDAPLAVDEHYERTQALLKKLKALKANDVQAYQALEQKAAAYRQALKENQQTDRGISQRHRSLLSVWAIVGFPFWLYGRINNFIPTNIPRLLVKKLGLYVGYNSTVKILSGIITFPLFYYLQTKLVKHFFGCDIGLIYLISLPISVLLAWFYQRYMAPKVDGWRWRRFEKKDKEKAATILGKRNELVLIKN